MEMRTSKIWGTITRMALGMACAAALHAFVTANAAMAAMDTPHNAVINCATCHQQPNATWWTDQGATLGLCGQCHYPGSPNGDATTHSSTTYNMTSRCTECHDPHYQRQLRTWKSLSFEATGAISAVTATTLTMTGAGWSTNQWAGHVLVPNTAYLQYNYMILSNTSETITIKAGQSINLTYAATGNTFAITYGSLVRQSIRSRPVKLFRKTGPNSLADGDAVIDGVCEVCHSQVGQGAHPADKAGQDCTECHSHTAEFNPDCASCHGAPPTVNTLGGPSGLAQYTDLSGTGSNNQGKHQKHAVDLAYGCSTCHTGYVMPQEGAKTVDLGFTNNGAGGGTYRGQAAVAYVGHGGTNVATKDGSRTCTNLYCHSTVQSGVDGTGAPTYKSVVWNSTAAAMTCNDCHASSPATGGHTLHLAISGTTCNTCHAGNTHADGSINVTSGGYNGGSVPRDGFGSCTSATCHQDGTAPNSYVTTPTWGVDAANCTACHSNAPATGAHTVHVTTAAYNCSQCHTSAIKDTSYSSTAHLDADIDVAVGGYTPNKPLGSAKESCASTCHGTLSPVWDNLAGTTGNCSLCHGMAANASDGRDTAGNTATNDPQVGAHVAHLTGANNYSAGISCTECHTDPAGATYMDRVKAAGHIDGDGVAEVPMNGTLARTNGALPNYAVATRTCSSVYCHGTNLIEGSNNGADTQPEWNQDAYLTGAPAKVGDCNRCHGAPPNTTNGSHSGSETLADCATCHDHFINTPVAGTLDPTKKALHIDGIVQYSGCTACHGQPPIAAATMVTTPPAGAETGRKTLFSGSNGGAGAHDFHFTTKGIGCNRCHNGGGDGGHPSRLQVTMGFNYGLNGGLYQAPTFSNSYTLRSGDGGLTTVQITGSTRVCSNIYCHSSGQAADGGAGGPVFATANWDNTATGACGACHRTTTGTAIGEINTGGHTVHLNTTVQAGITCEDCHTGAGTGVAGSPDYTDNASHLNQLINVAAGLTYELSPGVPADGTPGNAYGACNAAACHDDGTGTSVPSPVWGASITDCSECHANVPATASHAKHVTSTLYTKAVCGDCHDGAVRGTTAPTTHLDNDLDVFDTAAGDLGYPQNVAKGGAPYDSCSTAYCHSPGQNATGGALTAPDYAIVTWGGGAACGSCHKVSEAAGLTSGSHDQHLGSAGVSGCADCHANVDNGGTTYNSTTHVNRNIDTAAAVNYSMGGTPANGYGTCATNNCHGTLSPTWGSDTTNHTCVKCHGVAGASAAQYTADNKIAAPGYVSTNPVGTGRDTSGATLPSDPDVGAHNVHLKSTLLAGAVACTECHANVDPLSASFTGHMNGAYNLDFGTIAADGGDVGGAMTPAPNYNGTSCSNTYCHNPSGTGGELASPGTGIAPSWINEAYMSGSTKSVANCSVCHGVPGDGSFPFQATHGSMTTDTQPANSCAGCHGHEGDSTGIVGQRHIDGIRYASGDCDSCHDYDAVGATYAGGVWTGGTWGKNAQDALTPTQGWGAHAKHINHVKTRLGIGTPLDPVGQSFGSGTPASVCGVCHPNNATHTMGGGVPNGRSIIPNTAYQFGPNPPVYNGAAGSSSLAAPKTCSNVSCHFKTTPVWSAY